MLLHIKNHKLYIKKLICANVRIFFFVLSSLYALRYLIKYTLPRGASVTQERFCRGAQHGQADFNFVCICVRM